MAEHVLLDLDGTLADPRDGFVASISHALENLGCEVPPETEIASHIGPPLERTMATLLGNGREEQIPEAIALYRARYADAGIYENSIYEGIPSALEEMRASGFSLYVATSKPHVFAERILMHFGLRNLFLAVYGSELDGTRSDKGELIAFLLSREGLNSQETLMVGDMPAALAQK